MRHTSRTKKLVFSALLITLEIVLTRFVQIPVLLDGFTNRISFGFLPVALGGVWGGVWGGGLIAFLADIIRALLFPQGAINPLFCMTAFLRGAIYGACFSKKVNPVRILLACFLNFGLVNIGLIPLFTAFSYGGTFGARFVIMFPVSAINLALQTLLLLLVLPPLERNLKNHV